MCVSDMIHPYHSSLPFLKAVVFPSRMPFLFFLENDSFIHSCYFMKIYIYIYFSYGIGIEFNDDTSTTRSNVNASIYSYSSNDLVIFSLI